MPSATRKILAAHWSAPGKGVVLMQRNWTAKDLPSFYIDGRGIEVARVWRMHPRRLAQFTGFYEEDGRICFLLDPKRFPHVNFEKRPVRVAGPFNHWGRDENPEHWELQAVEGPGGETLYEARIPRGEIGSGGKVIFKFVTSDWHWLTPLRCAPNVEYDKAGNANYKLDYARTGQHAFEFELGKGQRGMDQPCQIGWDDNGSIRSLTPVLPGMAFFDLYSDKPLGAIIQGRRTIFRLFAPRATAVRLELYDAMVASVINLYDMELSDDLMTWEIELKGNLHGWFYTYSINGENDGVTTEFDFSHPVTDPYAKAVCSHEGPGIVVDDHRMKKPRRRWTPPEWQDLVIMECHVRDIAAKAPVDIPEEDRLGFKGVTAYLQNEMCYLRTVGTNAIEFQPVQQFDGTSKEEYHWGYMTTNYFSPCAWYGSDPENFSQNDEFFDLVETCHFNGQAVILDVVYNHVGVPNNLSKIDKAYYFYLSSEGEYLNWSGCGNTLNAESAMAKRLIKDSLLHLVRMYDVDGFRFDLAELLSVETLREAGDALKAEKESIILIAEPWSFRGSSQWDMRLAGYAFWNDGFRETIAEYVKGRSNGDALAYFMKGCLDHMAAWPSQSVNYVASHDDRCWLDKITTNRNHDGSNPSQLDIQRTHLAAVIILCSVGVPMISAGMDFLRSKQGVNNTYQRGDLNALDYGRLERFGKTHHFFQQLIGFRRSEWGELLRLWDNPSPGYLRLFKCDRGDRSAAAILFNADAALGPRQVLVAVNPHNEQHSVNLYDVDGMHWVCIADNETINFDGLFDHRLDGHHHRLNLGKMDAGIWVRRFPDSGERDQKA